MLFLKLKHQELEEIQGLPGHGEVAAAESGNPSVLTQPTHQSAKYTLSTVVLTHHPLPPCLLD